MLKGGEMFENTTAAEDAEAAAARPEAWGLAGWR